MTTKLTRVDDVAEYCPACSTCLDRDPDECPECGQARYRRGWKPLELCPHAYLGYELDGRYLLDRYLGGGASGEVYRAMDRKLQRPFALKIVEFSRYDDGSDQRDEQMRRFRNEVQALSRLRNPHVINIFESFQLEQETSALLTEYIDGVTLDELFDEEGVLGFDRAAQIVRQLANGIHEAHEQGVVHRDIKPGNVMVEQLPAAGFFARILDFGLVYMIEDVSQTHGFRGTPLYASPEQCMAEGKVDSRSDIYALGCMFFHCLTGEPPFGGEDAVEVMEAHCQKKPPTLNKIRPALKASEELEDLVAQMLRKDPEERPEDLRVVIAALDEIAERRQVSEPVLTSGGEETTVAAEEATEVDEEAALSGVTTSVAMSGGWSSVSDDFPAELLQSVDLDEFLTGYADRATALRLGDRGRCIVLADGDHKVHLISRGSRAYSEVFSGAQMRLTGLASHLAGGHLYASEMNGSILRWTIDRVDQEPKQVAEFADRVLAIDVDREGRRLFAGTETGEVYRHDLRTGDRRLWGHLDQPICQLCVGGADGLLAGTITGEVELISNDDGTTERTPVATLDGEPTGLVVEPRHHWGAMIERDGRLQVRDLRDVSSAFNVEPVPSGLRSVAFSANGQILGLTLEDSMLQLWVFYHEPIARQTFQ